MSTEATTTSQRRDSAKYPGAAALLLALVGCIAIPVAAALGTLPDGAPDAMDMQKMLLWRVFAQGVANATLALLSIHAFMSRRVVWGCIWVVLFVLQAGLAVWAISSSLVS